MNFAEKHKSIYDALVDLGVRHPRVEFDQPAGEINHGWYYVAFGRSEYIYLGRDIDDALEAIDDWRAEREHGAYLSGE